MSQLSRLSWSLVALGLLGFCLVSGDANAQEPKPADAAAPAAADAPPAEAPAADASKGDAPAADAGATKAPESKSYLKWAIEASGPIGFVLLLISVYMSALIIKLFLEFRMTEAVPPALVEKLETAIKEKKFQEAYDACRESESFLAKLVRTGVAALPNGRAEAKEAMSDVQEEIVTGYEAKVGYLAIIGQLGPMIGLVGTIMGMIESFQTIATSVGAQARPDEIARGISMALFITLEGISLSVPAIFFFAFFRNRIAQLAVESSKVADRTITALLAAAKQAKQA